MFYPIFGPRASGGYGCKSGGGFCCILIVLIFFMAVNVVISALNVVYSWQVKKQIEQKRKIGVCLIVFGGLSLVVLYGYFTRGVRKKQGT